MLYNTFCVFFFLKVILDEVQLTVLSMAKSYVKFEVSNDVVSKTYEALQLAKQSGTVRKGSNEVTKSVERGLATFVVIAADVEPEEGSGTPARPVRAEEDRYSYVSNKADLGKSIGMTVPCTAIAVENAGTAANAIKDIISKVTGSMPSAPSQRQEQKPQQEKESKPRAPKKQQAPQGAPTKPEEPAQPEQQ